MVLDKLRRAIIDMGHDSSLEGHPGKRRMNAIMRRNFYWPNMAVHIYAWVAECRNCTAERTVQHKCHRELKLFTAVGPLEYIAMDILRQFPHTASVYQYILVICDRCSKLTQTVPFCPITASGCASEFLYTWVLHYGVPVNVQTDPGKQFVTKFFRTLCHLIGSITSSKVVLPPKTGEPSAITIIIALAPLTYAYNANVHRTTNYRSFELGYL